MPRPASAEQRVVAGGIRVAANTNKKKEIANADWPVDKKKKKKKIRPFFSRLILAQLWGRGGNMGYARRTGAVAHLFDA